jgi:hypothetical protein
MLEQGEARQAKDGNAMRVILCSEYLRRQQERAEAAAVMALGRPITRPAGFWGQVGWWLGGREIAARLARLGAARGHERDALRYAQGRGGEELLARVLGRELDARYTLLRNYTPLLDRRGDVDAVLIGPHGVTSFEVKAWRGYYRATGDTWLMRDGPTGGWRPVEKSPIQQALENARRLRGVLARGGLERVPVKAVVAVASSHMYVEIEPPRAAFIFFATRPQPNLAVELGPAVLSERESQRVLDALLPPTRQ